MSIELVTVPGCHILDPVCVRPRHMAPESQNIDFLKLITDA